MAIIEALRDVGSISSYLSKCAYLRKAWIEAGDRPGEEETLWYRAQPEENLGLTPKLYRPEYRGAYEAEIRQEFQSRATQLKEGRLPQTKYDWYFLMQHYGAPTRLLDWTENPLVALYFAVRTLRDSKDNARKYNPVVWVLNPWWLNSKLKFKNDRRVEGPILPDWKEADRYLRDLEKAFELDSDTAAKLPAAIEPPYVDRRIASQVSRFVIFGQARDLSKIKSARRDDCRLAKIVIQRKVRARLLDELERMGTTETNLFLDLEHLCQDISRRWEKR
jgi:hypothetical protein